MFRVSCSGVVVVWCLSAWFMFGCWSCVCRCVSFVVYCALCSVCWPLFIYRFLLCVVLIGLRDVVDCPLFVVDCLRSLVVVCYLLLVVY